MAARSGHQLMAAAATVAVLLMSWGLVHGSDAADEAAAASAAAAVRDYTNYTLLKFLPAAHEGGLEDIVQLTGRHRVGLWSEPNRAQVSPVLGHVSPDRFAALQADLIRRRHSFEVLSTNLQALIAAQLETNGQSLPVGSGRVGGVVSLNEDDEDAANEIEFNLDAYHPLEVIESHLRDLQTEFPDLVSLQRYGKSYEGRDLLSVILSRQKSGLSNGLSGGGRRRRRRVVLIECGIHAREWVSPASCLRVIHWALRHKTRSRVLDTFDLHVIPIANPDGYVWTWTGDRLWRKTRSHNPRMPACRGVDPNRNFDSAFGKLGASHDPCNDAYGGERAFSEAESLALADYVRNLTSDRGSGGGVKLEAYFAIHSFSQLWMYPYGYTDELPPNADQLHALSTAAVQAISEPYGTRYTFGPISKVIYMASGSSLDWAYDAAGVRLVFALELRDTGDYGFLLPASQIQPTAEELWLGIHSVLQQIA